MVPSHCVPQGAGQRRTELGHLSLRLRSYPIRALPPLALFHLPYVLKGLTSEYRYSKVRGSTCELGDTALPRTARKTLHRPRSVTARLVGAAAPAALSPGQSIFAQLAFGVCSEGLLPQGGALRPCRAAPGTPSVAHSSDSTFELSKPHNPIVSLF